MKRIHLLLVRNDAPLDFQLLFQVGQLPLHVLKLGTVRLKFVVLPNFVLQRMLCRRVFIALVLEHREVQRRGYQRASQDDRSPLLQTRQFTKIRHKCASRTFPSRRSA